MFSSLVKRLVRQQIPVNISHGETFLQKKPFKMVAPRYDRDGAFPFQCFLYSDCGQVEEDCDHCYSGPGQTQTYTQIIGNMQSTGVCRPASSNNCSPLKEDFGEINVYLFSMIQECEFIKFDSGGTWYCFPDIGLNQPVPAGTK